MIDHSRYQALCIPELLRDQAQRIPCGVVIAAPGRPSLTYTRLWSQAADVVRKLNAVGVGRNDRVAVVVPNGPEMAVAFVAVACCATAAPLNPAYRANEFDFYLSDLKARALIVQAGMDSPALAVARERSIPIIELSPVEEDAAGIFTLTGDQWSAPFRGDFAEAEDIALILHTSGTTSRPKMVPLTHSNLLASAAGIAATLQLTDADRCLNVMPLFHIHGLVGAVLSSMIAGSSVVCTEGFNAPQFFAWMEKFLPTWYTAVPTMHQAVLARSKDNREAVAQSSLRLIRSSSAPLPAKVMAELEDLFKVPVIESYGMTEGSHQIASNPLPPRARKPGSVGVATGSDVAIMDETGNLLPSGEAGEIVIRGGNVMSGYENDPKASKSAFTNGWLRTGDQGYLDIDGYLFITGRFKEIINRGGEKVSPSEVDEVLMDHPSVAQVVAFGMPHTKLGEDVAAAVVLHEKASATEREIQEFAASRLAEYKIPRRVVIVKEIPKSATGKLQRIGLAEKLGLTASDRTAAEKLDFVAPRTVVEEMLAKIWSQVLRIASIGVHDNFFDLGGDSILASQIISRVRDALRVELSFLIFFEAPTVASMAAGIESLNRDDRSPAATPISPVRRHGELPLSFAQQRLWFFDQMEPGSSAYNRPSFLRLKGRLDTVALERSLNEIVRRHEVLRTTFRSMDGRPYQIISSAPNLTLPIVDLRELAKNEREAEARRLAAEEAQRRFDLVSGPLLRATLLRLGEEEHILLLTTHHIAFDGWSDGVLFQELAALYKAFSAGQPSPLSELSIQYADFSAWQRQLLQEKGLEAQLSYWKRQLAGAPAALELPTDRPRPAVQTFRGARQTMLLPRAMTDALKTLGRQESVTLFMMLLAAFKVLLCRYTGQHDIVVGTPIAGRNRVETEKLIGVFINTLVLRTDLSGDPSFRELLGRTRKMFLEAYAHQDLPIEKLVEELQPERGVSRNPLFQVMFQLRNAPKEAVEFPGLTMEELDFDSGTATLDLTLEILEKAEGLTCWFDYNTDLFDAATISRMLEHFRTLLEGIVVNADQRISDQPILTASGKQQVLVETRLQRARRFRCFIIGGSMLPIQCAQRLMAHGHTVLGIASDDPAVQNWAVNNRIDCLRYDGSGENLAAFLKQPFDYLFSIFSPYLLPADILALPRRLAINYHNAPLPRYGGMHVTSWALINREERHGITWHVMAERIDTGDILEQRTFDISTEETAIGLNTRCHQAALDAFETLIDKLATGEQTTTPQDLGTRTYFPRARRPAACCTLDWHKPAEEIHALIRALDFSDHFNPLGLPKISINQEFVAVKTAKVTQTTSDSPPGTIVDLSAETMRVSTTSHDLVITELQTLSGQPLSPTELATRFDLKTGVQLPSLGPALIESLTSYNAAVSHYESFWVKKLVELHPSSLPYPGSGDSLPAGEVRTISAMPMPERLNGWLTERSCSRETFLLAAFVAYLSRLSDTARFDLGFMSTDLQQVFIEEPFYNLFAPFVPFSINLSEAATLSDALLHIEAQRTVTIRHQTFPRDIIARYPELRSSGLWRAGLRWPVGVMTAYTETAPADHPALLDSDITLVIPADGVGLGTLHWVYDPQRFDCREIISFQEQFLTFLTGMMETPGVPLADLPLLSPAEETRLLYTWNATTTHHAKEEQPIHHLIEAQAAQTPDATAVQFETQLLTYDELNRQANQLAHYLGKRGVGPDVLVGLCVERSLEMVVGLLGILKAGGAYVPLDPAYPREHLASILADTQMPILLTQTHLLDRLPNYDGQLICLDDAPDEVRGQADTNPFPTATATNLAYVIYTSGSTGQPKGVMVEHRALVNFTEMIARHYGVTAEDRVLQFASISFDASAEEIYPALTRGATLVLRTDEMPVSGETFCQHCRDLGLTVLDLPTAYWHELVSNLPKIDPPFPKSLRLVIIGGEQAVTELVKVWLEHTLPTVLLVNSYGPTEATVVATVGAVGKIIAQNVPIGRPIGNVQIYVLNEQMHPVPIGIPGELYIGGGGLARGYLNHPELTVEKFIPNPFSSEPGARLYKTGDLARYLPDGNIEFLGRIDNQVKIRGFRIELGEIEAVLGKHPAVRETVVLARDEVKNRKSKIQNPKSAGKRLVAYVIPKPDLSPSTTELRSFLKEKLPDYMIPSAFVFLDALPLTLSGKVDRRALPAPDYLRPELEAAYVAPNSDLERQIVEVWQAALGIEKVGVYDNFFEIGGHSLLIVRVQNELRKVLGQEISVVDLFRYPTISSLANYLSEDSNAQLNLQSVHDRARRQRDAWIPHNRPLGRNELPS